MPLEFAFTAPGNYTIEDDGVPGNNTSVVRDGDGVVILTFVHPADLMVFTVDVPGVHVTLNLTDPFAGDFKVGNFSSIADNPDSIVMQNLQAAGIVTLISNGSIVEGGNADAAADIVAGAVIMSAASGIGVPGNAIETQTGLFEAETTTGGIAIGNFGAVQIGGLSASVDGLDVATSGDISFTNLGSISLTDTTGAEMVHGGNSSGNVTLIANGFDSSIIANANEVAINAQRGSITLTAALDIQFGTAGANFANDVLASGSITMNAGRDVLIDGNADVLSDNFSQNTGGNLSITAGRNISILNSSGTGSAGVAASGDAGADVLLTTGFGGTLTVRGPGVFGVGSITGDIVVRADRLVIDAASGITTLDGSVTIGPATDGRPIILGSASDAAFAVELSDAEIDRIFTDDLFIGTDQTGTLTVIAPITVTAVNSASNVFLTSATAINLNSSFTTTGSLTLRSLDDVFQGAASTITTGALSVFVDFPDDDPGTGGTGTFNGSFAVATNVLSGNADVDILNGNGVANIIQGFGGNDLLRGFGGADTLDGGLGIDTMFGGTGNDTFRVDNNNDVVNEAAGEGDDSLTTSITFALGAGSEVETIATNNALSTATITLSGNEFGQSIFGNEGINSLFGFAGIDALVGGGGGDLLDGGTGGDVMRGGTGNDTMIVDNAGDLVFENVGEGDDIVIANVNYVLQAGAEVETITNTTAANLALTGNEFGQSILGNAGVNTLNGGGGVDSLSGFGDNDVLIGGAGADVMRGGTGLDNYNVDNAGDLVFENVGEGDDTLSASVSYALADGVEIETIATTNGAGTGAIDLAGNDFSQSIFGNNGINVLSGNGGIDSLSGFAGNDVLIGGGGNDVLNGGADRDDYRFNTNLNAATNVDTIIGFVTITDGISLDDAVFTALAPGALPAGAFRTGASAADADDRIIYDSTTGALFYDADGVGGAAQVQFATLQGAPALAGSDFVVI